MKVFTSRPVLLGVIAAASSAAAFVPRTTSAASPSFAVTSSTTKRGMIANILDLLGGAEPGLVSPAEALPGRTQKMPNIDGLRHF